MSMMAQRTVPLIALLAIACGGESAGPVGPATEHSITEAEIEALPMLTVEDGRLICVGDGYSACPVGRAYANRVGGDRFALWEPGLPITIWSPGDTAGKVLGLQEMPYMLAAAVREHGRGFQVIDAGYGTVELKNISADGRLEKSEPLPGVSPLTGIGFVGPVVITHRLAEWESDSGAYLRIEKLPTPADTSGITLAYYRIPWLVGGPEGPLPPPLIAHAPVYGVTDQGEAYRTAGGLFEIEFVDRNGNVRWILRGPDGQPVSEAEVDARLAELGTQMVMAELSEDDIAAMRSRSASEHAPVTGILPTRSGDALVALANIPGRNDIDWLRLGRDGRVTARFVLSRATMPLLAEGDSILVQRPGEGEPQEIRWLRLRREQ